MDMEGKDFKHTICTFLYMSAQAFGESAWKGGAASR